MIRRDILENPDTVLATFDWFNDYKDTRNWLMGNSTHAGPIIHRLDVARDEWLKKNWGENTQMPAEYRITAEETLLCSMTATLLAVVDPREGIVSNSKHPFWNGRLCDAERTAEAILKSRLAKRTDSQ